VPHPTTKPEINAALEANAASIAEFFASQPDRAIFAGDPEHWGPAHHLVHLTRTSADIRDEMRSGPPLHPTAQSRTYPQLIVAAAASLAATPKARLLEMGRVVVVAPGATRAALVDAFAAASAALRAEAETWSEEELDRRALTHPLMGRLTAREMLLFCVFHERHHLRGAKARVEAEN
jgi:hypothetical protein